MNLNISEWKPFIIEKLFTVKYGVNLELSNCDEIINNEEIGIKFVSRTESNNGVSATVMPIENVIPQKAGLISVAGGGSVLSTFIQPEPFYSGRDLYTLEAKDNISFEAKMFIITIIKANKYKYSYGRQANKTLPYLELMLPVVKDDKNAPIIDKTCKYSDEGYVPDWQFMENYIKSLHYKPLTTKNTNGRTLELKTKEWKRFYLGRLFDIKKGKRLTSEDQEEGNNLYIGAIDSNNGVANHIGQSPIHKGTTISLSYNGSVGEAFYQPDPYWATDDVNVLYSKYSGFNKYIGLFIATVIRQEKYRFSYGRKWTLENMVNTEICLPIRYNSNDLPYIDDTNKYSDEGYIPDWQFMEDYIKSLPYGDRI